MAQERPPSSQQGSWAGDTDRQWLGQPTGCFSQPLAPKTLKPHPAAGRQSLPTALLGAARVGAGNNEPPTLSVICDSSFWASPTAVLCVLCVLCRITTVAAHEILIRASSLCPLSIHHL